MKRTIYPHQIGNLRVTPVIYRRLKAEAGRNGLPLAAMARSILAEALAQRQAEREAEREPA